MWFAVGIEESDGQQCECCGTPCPKRRIVLQDDESSEYKRLGTVCAAMAVNPSSKRHDMTNSDAKNRIWESMKSRWNSVNDRLRSDLVEACRKDHPTADFMLDPKWFPTSWWVDQRRGCERFARCVDAWDKFKSHQETFKKEFR